MAAQQSKKVIKALWVIPSLAGGGAEKAVMTILNHLDRSEIRPFLCLFKKEGPFLAELASDVEIFEVNADGRINPLLVWRLSRIIHRLRPDVTIGVLRACSILTTLAHQLAGRPGKIYLNEQNTPSIEMAQFGNAAIKAIGYRPFLNMADGVLALSSGIKQDLVSHYSVAASRICVIPNPVDLENAARHAGVAPPHPWLADPTCCTLVSVGRLHPQKGHDILLRAFAQLAQIRNNLRLLIVGTGPEAASLKSLAERLGIEGAVEFVGFQSNPYAFISHADLFVLASRYEGFGIVLAEALAVGTAAVATNCPSGPADILQNGTAGALCPPENPEALAKAIAELLDDPERRDALIAAGRKHVKQYGAAAVAAQYINYFKEQVQLES